MVLMIVVGKRAVQGPGAPALISEGATSNGAESAERGASSVEKTHRMQPEGCGK